MSEAKTERDGAPRAKHLHLDLLLPSIVEWFEERMRKVVRDELAAAGHPADGWRDQRRSTLGPRRHCLAVRRRLEADPNDPSAKIVGDRFLLTAEALAEELDRLGLKSGPATAPAPRKPQSPEAEAKERVQRRLRQVK
jgi:hypothetical protein